MELKVEIRMHLLWLSFILVSRSGSFLHTYHTNRNCRVGKYDCFVHFDTSMATMNMEFCRRPFNSWHFVELSREDRCLQQKQTFRQMRDDGISSIDLFVFFAPIDVIDRYQAFLENSSSFIGDKKEVEDDYFCNCSDSNLQAFGRNCEYRFGIISTKDQRHIFSQMSKWFLTIIDVQERIMLTTRSKKHLITSGTCYQGLPECHHIHPGLCIQWNQVCDGE